MKYFDLNHKKLLRSGGICGDLTVHGRSIDFVPTYFIRTGEKSIEVLFNMMVTFLIPDVKKNDSRNVTHKIYNEIKQIFSKRDMSDFEGFISFDDCQTDPESMVQHCIDNSWSVDCVIASPDSKRYTILTIESYVVFEINFDNSCRINKMIITKSDKYLGRYLLHDEKRTDLLLQDKET